MTFQIVELTKLEHFFPIREAKIWLKNWQILELFCQFSYLPSI